MRNTIFGIIFAFTLVLWGGLVAHGGVMDPGLESAIQMMGPDDEVSVIVTLSDKTDLKAYQEKDKALRRSKIIQALKSKADLSQKPLKDFLEQKKANKVISLWIINGLAVTARAEVIKELANQPKVQNVRLDDTLSAPEPTPAGEAVPEWNINVIRSPELWALGYRGTGTVVASMDTGVDASHQDLASRWRGGANSWFDPNGEHDSPYDSAGHGTQIIGVMVGGNATGTAIGVAPGAQWIAVKIFDDAGVASYSDIHQGFQWLLDPDKNPATNDAPDVVNNSWGNGKLVNTCFAEFQEDVQILKAAEIALVFSAGNEGPSPSTSVNPANYPEGFAVGAVNEGLSIALFSSRGPSACDGSIYPEVVAPGVDVKTSDLTYKATSSEASTYVSGTSIAAAHVSGAIALLLSAFPEAAVGELESALTQSALYLGTEGADNDYGYGLIDVVAAYGLLEQGSGECADADGDGYSTDSGCGQDCNDNDPTIYPGAPEIKHDGIDQDCNGYDLTIDITKATYVAKDDSLSVVATSALGGSANLELVGYGAMQWDSRKGLWKISVRKAGGDPGTVTVSGIEGSETGPTTANNG